MKSSTEYRLHYLNRSALGGQSFLSVLGPGKCGDVKSSVSQHRLTLA